MDGAVVKSLDILKEKENYEKQLKETQELLAKSMEEVQRLKQSALVLTGAKLSLGRLLGEEVSDKSA
ncbi:unknown [Feldmannia species virus]|uniref:Uncharacterized protein n=1 Tax=Feldmannia species virus TaxID=39420 RepID=B5LWB8_9PHYC|nr:hypothetical protein FeldSpV_gp029 [Feldmannia species virus]ACH46781.1 unknown [Feldmannia species virus]